MSSPLKQVPNFSLLFCSEFPPMPTGSVRPHPHLLGSNLPSPKSTTTFSKSPRSWCDDLVLARRTLLEARPGDLRSLAVRNRMDKNSGELLPALLSTPAADNHGGLDSAYFLHSLFRNQQRICVGDEHRKTHLLPSEPTKLLRKKLREQVIERRRLQRQAEEGNSRPRRTMNTLRALMLKGNKQAEAEYFQRREEEEQASCPENPSGAPRFSQQIYRHAAIPST
jgi:hypothetical protein